MRRKVVACLVGVMLMQGIAGVTQASSINLAPGGTATQSSNGFWGWEAGPWLANDGNTNMSYYGGASVAHTLYNYKPWWEVDLHNLYDLDKIVIWNRSDGGAEWLTNFDVTVSDENHDTVWTQNYYGAGGYPYPTLAIDLPENVAGEFVKVQRRDWGYLMLTEVQVFGTDAPAAAPVPEPSTIILLGAGLMGFIGGRGAFRRSRPVTPN